MFRNVLVTLDGSRCSEAILPVIAELAAETHACLTLFSVGEPPSATPEGPAIDVVIPPGVYTRAATLPRYVETRTQAIERRQQELREYLEDRARPLRERGIAARVEVALAEDAGEAIAEYARRHAVDLIAMATHGRTGLRSLIFGSVTSKVVASGVRPVLVVRPDGLAGPP